LSGLIEGLRSKQMCSQCQLRFGWVALILRCYCSCYDEGSEYIQVHDGLNETSVLLAEYCQTDEGLENHPQVLSSGQHLRMSYVASGRAIDRHPQRVVFEAMATFVSIKRGKKKHHVHTDYV